MKKALVISHERSGTSFLINTIAENFPDYLPEFTSTAIQENDQGKQVSVQQCNRVDIDGAGWNFADPDEMRKFLSDPRFHDIPIRNIFKSHHPRQFFTPIWDYLLEQFAVFYIYRDGRDVMCSFWRHVRKQGFLWGPMTFTVSEFMRAMPTGAVCRYHAKQPTNMAERWDDHVMSWLEYRLSGVCYISYDNMLEHFDTIVEKVGAHLEMDLPSRIIRPGVGGVHPGKGIAGAWEDIFHDGDVAFFQDYARRAMRLITGEPCYIQ